MAKWLSDESSDEEEEEDNGITCKIFKIPLIELKEECEDGFSAINTMNTSAQGAMTREIFPQTVHCRITIHVLSIFTAWLVVFFLSLKNFFKFENEKTYCVGAQRIMFMGRYLVLPTYYLSGGGRIWLILDLARGRCLENQDTIDNSL